MCSCGSKERFSNLDSYEPQLHTAYPSNIQVGYQSMGNGTRNSRTYVTPDYAPTITTVGIHDQYNHWTAWPDVVAAYSLDYDANWLGIPMLDKGHDMAAGFQPDLGYLREEAVEKFFSNYLEPQLPPNILYVSPFNGLENENAINSDQSVIIHFSPAMYIQSVKDAIQIVEEGTNQIIEGGWKITRKGTYFEFTPAAELTKNKRYKVSIGTQAKSVHGIYLSQSYEHSFLVNEETTPLPFTHPTPQSLPYHQNFSQLTSTAYPPEFQGWKIVDAEPNLSGRTGSPIADIALKPATNATTDPGIYNFSNKIGLRPSAYRDFAIALALNTMDVPSTQQVKITFDAMTMRNAYNGITNDILLGLIFQYRIGKTGPFIPTTTVYESNTEQNLTGTDGKNATTFSVILPKSCSGHPVIQFRWICKKILGSTGERQSFAIDNIIAEELLVTPIELISFKGINETQHIKLNWVTASERDNSHFDILRSADGKLFDKIGMVQGIGTSDIINNYSYTDRFPYKGNNYYKLKQVDFNGKPEESQVIVVKILSEAQEINIFQRDETVYVQVYAATEGSGTLMVTNISGKILSRQKVNLTAGNNQFDTNLNTAPKGFYLVTLLSAGEKPVSTKFIK